MLQALRDNAVALRDVWMKDINKWVKEDPKLDCAFLIKTGMDKSIQTQDENVMKALCCLKEAGLLYMDAMAKAKPADD